jgi:hypothetical protein
MKTYLTNDQFADLLFEVYGRKIESNPIADASDRVIWSMFQQYEKDVKDTLEGSMWDVDEFNGDDVQDLIGYRFHKSFRQTDVIPAKHIDGIVWTCMQEAPLFWSSMEKACKILTSEDAAQIYKDDL